MLPLKLAVTPTLTAIQPAETAIPVLLSADTPTLTATVHIVITTETQFVVIRMPTGIAPTVATTVTPCAVTRTRMATAPTVTATVKLSGAIRIATAIRLAAEPV